MRSHAVLKIMLLVTITTAFVFWPVVISFFQVSYIERPLDSYGEMAVVFAQAAYVRDWDNGKELFKQAFRDTDGSYQLQQPLWGCSQAFNQLARSQWNMYFNVLQKTDANGLQDAQVLTGSRKVNDKITLVISFRGSDKYTDYVFTNCKTRPVSLTFRENSQDTGRVWLLDVARMVSLLNSALRLMEILNIKELLDNAVMVWLSNLVPHAPTLAHQGVLEQAASSLSASIVDPEDGNLVTIKEVLAKYPEAEVIVTGHSLGGGDAAVFTLLLKQGAGLVATERLHTRTFAPVGALNKTAQKDYSSLDIKNYFFSGDPIFISYGLTGFRSIGSNVLLSPRQPQVICSSDLHDISSYYLLLY